VKNILRQQEDRRMDAQVHRNESKTELRQHASINGVFV
jgi:hypothetical protein